MTSSTWADKPWPLIETPSKTKNVNEHSSVYIANEMAFAHNAMIRGINSIYNQAPYVHKAKDITDFLFFIRSWANWVGHHHNLEETLMFPSFEEVMGKPGFLQANVDQHHAFEPGLKKLEAFAIHTKAEDYKSDILQGIIDDFANGLQGHLSDEIPTLLAMRPYDSAALLKAYKKCEAVAGKQDRTVVPPMVLGLCDKTFQGGNNWPVLPWIAPHIVHYLLERKHAGSWRFLPCDAWGKPRPLALLGE